MNAVISGYYGYNNTGDELILKAVLSELKSINNKLNFVVLSANPKETELLHEVKSVYRFNPIRVIKEIRKSEILISGGGGLFQDVTSKRSIIYYLAIILIAKIFSKKVIIYSQGIGPINSRLNILFTKFVLKKVDFITVRDKESKYLLNSFGIDNVVVKSDPVLNLDLSEFKKTQYEERKVGIVVRNIKNNRYKEIIANVADRIIREKKLKVIFIPFQVESDLKIAEEIRNMMKEDSTILNINKDKYWLKEIVSQISSLRLLIGMRLHSIILANKFDIPYVAISYDPKIANFLKSINYERMINLKNLNETNLLSEIDYVLSRIQDNAG